MKDLTHYFVSPPKSGENGENSSLTTAKTTNVLQNTSGNEIGENNATRAGKRSRVKIRISLKDPKNRSCDIISSKNDVVDKTPSPLMRRSLKKGDSAKNDVENGISISPSTNQPREETPNAFKLLMTRNKAANPSCNDNNLTPTTLPEIDKKEYKAKLKQSREKLVALAESKGYSKRKLAEIEEAELIESRLKKRAKLFRKTEKDEKKEKRKKKDRGATTVDNQNRDSCDNLDNNNVRNNDQKNDTPRAGKNLTDRNSGAIRLSQSENCSPSRKDQTPKSKTKWTMRVKLQSHSDNDVDDDNPDKGGDNERSASDEDHIFTPKSKVKYKKRKIPKSTSDTEAKEVKKPEAESEEHPKKEESAIPDPPDSSKHREKKNRVKSNIMKPQNSEIEDPGLVDTSWKDSSPGNDADRSVEILGCDLADNEAPVLLRETKLAPLFVRRSKPNPAALEARRSFLKSGIPETVKKIINSEQRPGSGDPGTYSMPFPAVSHVSQTELDSGSESSSSGVSYRWKSDERDSPAALSLDLSKFESLWKLGKGVSGESRETNAEKFVKIDKESLETVLKDVETRCADIRKMWESVSSAASNRSTGKSPKSHKRTKKLKLQRRSENLGTEENTESPNPTWTCKYKPMSCEEVVGNESATSKLRNWLSGWRIPSPKDDCSSGDEFYSSDCSGSSCYENNQVAVLLGPHGSGKTASVYAIAEELGYRVLEVNASSRRTGKKILTDFQEATKSHRVKRDQSTLPLSKKKRVPQNSLILIEDVDLIFEEDEGFVSATFQLAANTRRPIVMTCRDHCTHLNKMAPQQQFIRFQTATGDRVSALLELVAFAESGYRIPRYCLDVLLRNGDLRQSLLQLQFILLSGPPSFSQLGSNGVLKWEDVQLLVYKPAIKSSRKNRKESTDSGLVSKRDRDLVDALAKKLDTVSLISSLSDVENPASPPWRGKLNPSLSLLEDFEPYSSSDDLGEEIADWLRLAALGSTGKILTSESSSESKAQQGIKRKVKLGIDVALSQAIPSTLEHRSKSTDYLPIIRDMCRSEEDRASINTKRGKRFHNYLHGLNLASASSNILSAASSVFKDKLLT